jgi:hypothetical protein
VTLARDEGGDWRVRPNASFGAAGLVPAGPVLEIDAPVQGAVARVTDSSVAVTFQVPPFSTFEAPADSETVKLARDRSGVIVGVTHALNPGELSDDQLSPELGDGRMLMGWVGVHGTRPAPRRTAPALGLTCVLHWNPKHMSVGKLIDRAPKILSSKRARAWAERVIGPGNGALHPWQLVDVNRPDDGWHARRSLSLEQYFLRRHTDGWKLVQAYSRADGVTVETDNEAKAWAAGVIQHRTGMTGLIWQPGPSTPDSTTLYASI